MSSKVLSVRTSASSKGRGTDMTPGGTGRIHLETKQRTSGDNNNENDVFRRFFSTDVSQFAVTIILCRDGE
jgi:hypothetical protein